MLGSIADGKLGGVSDINSGYFPIFPPPETCLKQWRPLFLAHIAQLDLHLVGTMLINHIMVLSGTSGNMRQVLQLNGPAYFNDIHVSYNCLVVSHGIKIEWHVSSMKYLMTKKIQEIPSNNSENICRKLVLEQCGSNSTLE